MGCSPPPNPSLQGGLHQVAIFSPQVAIGGRHGLGLEEELGTRFPQGIPRLGTGARGSFIPSFQSFPFPFMFPFRTFPIPIPIATSIPFPMPATTFPVPFPTFFLRFPFRS